MINDYLFYNVLQLLLLKSFGILAQENALPSINEGQKSEDLISHDNGSKTKLNETQLEDTSMSKENDTNTFFNNTEFFEKSINTDAVFRGFYVVLALGCMFLIYIGIKTFRLKRNRAANRYKVIATKGEDQESFFPLAADDGEDEEIFNASNHQGYT